MDTMLGPARTDLPAGPKPRPRTGKRASPALRALTYLLLTAAAAAVLLPFYWMVASSLKTNGDVFTVPVKWWPHSVVWHNYLDI